MRKIIDIKEITTNEKIAIGIICIILLSIATSFVSSLWRKEIGIDYKTLNITELIDSSFEVKSREEYWILNNIIYSFLSSYNNEISSTGLVNSKTNTGYTRDSYYKVISSEYKKVLSKKEYMNLSKIMMEKFVTYENNQIFIKYKDIIDSIYELDSNTYAPNMYICKLKPIREDAESYIGIELLDNNSYNIFYIE